MNCSEGQIAALEPMHLGVCIEIVSTTAKQWNKKQLLISHETASYYF
jgi:hypothetical protein